MTRPLKATPEQEVDGPRCIKVIEQELFPGELQLLDARVLQNPDWVDHRIESYGFITCADGADADLTERYAAELANDVMNLGILYKEFEDRSSYRWMVSRAAKSGSESRRWSQRREAFKAAGLFPWSLG